MQVLYGPKFVFVSSHITQSHYHQYTELSAIKEPVSEIKSILPIISYAIYSAVCYQLAHFSFDGYHDDVIEWKPFPRYWPFVRGIHRSQGWWFEMISLPLWRHCNIMQWQSKIWIIDACDSRFVVFLWSLLLVDSTHIFSSYLTTLFNYFMTEEKT